MPQKLNFCILFCFLLQCCFSQTTKKTLQTKFSSEKITIDGKFDEEIWKTAQIATDFVMEEPDNGKLEPKERKSEVKVVYDHEAIYIAATLYDNNPESIKRELILRDDFGVADHFGVLLNGYNDGQQEFRFFVSSAGVQQDCIYTEAKNEDFTWNAIWDSKVAITDIGWVVEMKIPFAAIRFPKQITQAWGINFYREVRNQRQRYTWNLFSNAIVNKATQSGILEGIENINTPTRLFLIPYSSYYLSNTKEQTKGELKGGLDIKYGLSDAFTLDAILVPDFGQTAFDRVELNLSPFEQQFIENRPFFTEGTELFSKGNLLYSRRIGGAPSYYPEINTDEEVTKYPEFVNLLNALKISGRTKKGLGIGVLNGITKKTFADIRNTVTGEERQEVVEPLTNFNVFVLDQRFRRNSSVAFINTNVTRNGKYRDANVSAIVFDLNTKKNTYNLSGDFKYSFLNEIELDNKKGFSTAINFKDTSGNFRFSTGGQYVSKDYDINDLGINFLTHYHNIYGNVSYRILNPTAHFNNFSVNLNTNSEFENRTGRLQGFSSNLNFNITDKKNDYYGFGFNIKPLKVYDFYEAQNNNEEKFVIIPENYNAFFFLSTNYNRKFAIDFKPSFMFTTEKDRIVYSILFAPRYRFSDKFTIKYELLYTVQNNNIGWIANDNTDIVFTRRDRSTYSNSLTGKYTLNNLMNLNLTIRHYLSYALNHTILTLQDDGTLINNNTYLTNKNSSFNTWNLDLSYSWWFAPGSQISVLYRNNAATFLREFSTDYSSNLNDIMNSDNFSHIFSISLRYFIDYNTLKKK